MPDQHLLIVYHSQSGTTEAMAQAVIRGASDPAIKGVRLRVRAALDAGPEDILQAHGVILGTPENFGYMSGGLKTFLDRSYHACLERTQGLPWALFVRAGNDGTGAVNSVERIVAGLRWKPIAAPLVVAGPAEARDYTAACERLGMTMAAGLEAGIF